MENRGAGVAEKELSGKLSGPPTVLFLPATTPSAKTSVQAHAVLLTDFQHAGF